MIICISLFIYVKIRQYNLEMEEKTMGKSSVAETYNRVPLQKVCGDRHLQIIDTSRHLQGIDAVRHKLRANHQEILDFNRRVEEEARETGAQGREGREVPIFGETVVRKFDKNYERANIGSNRIKNVISPGQNKNKTKKNIMTTTNISVDYMLHNVSSTLYHLPPKTFVKVHTPYEYYPPACSAYDMAFTDSKIFVYGGIPCNSELSDGLKQHFYCYSRSPSKEVGKKVEDQNTWKEIRPLSMYSPTPRYGHTLTAIHNSYLLLFGGVSEYKEKLKDRCFYAEVWAYSIQKNVWKIMEFVGTIIKNPRGHAACVYKGYYLVHGGIDDAEEVIEELAWVFIGNSMGNSSNFNQAISNSSNLNQAMGSS